MINRKHKTWKICFSYNEFKLPLRKQLKIDDHFADSFKAYFSKGYFIIHITGMGESTYYLSLKPSTYRIIQE